MLDAVAGPLAYVGGAADMLVTCSTSMYLEAYRYTALAAATSDQQGQQQPEPEPAGRDAGSMRPSAGVLSGARLGSPAVRAVLCALCLP
jgi:hypothetical protein